MQRLSLFVVTKQRYVRLKTW